MSVIEQRKAAAGELADWLTRRGHHRQARVARGIRATLGRYSVDLREIARLRSKLTPITQARIREARKPLDDELRTTADQLERMGKIADTEGHSVPIEMPDTAYLADLLRRAASV